MWPANARKIKLHLFRALVCLIAYSSITEASSNVLSVAPGSAAADAGVQSGDVLLDWRRGETHGDFTDPFLPSSIETEQPAGSSVTLHGRRGAARLAWSITASPWGLTAAPDMEPALAKAYEEGAVLRKEAKFVAAGEAWRQAATHSSGSIAAWLLFQAANAFVSANRWDDGTTCFASALQQSPLSKDAVIQIESSWAASYFQQGVWDQVKIHDELALAQANSPELPLTRADLLVHLGRSYLEQRQPKAALPLISEALALRERLLSGTLSVADALNGLGRAYQYLDQLPQAEEQWKQAQTLTQALAPRGSLNAALLHNLGIAAAGQDQFDSAEKLFLRSMEISSGLKDGETQWANTASSLGSLKRKRGDLSAAEKYLELSLAIRRRLQPDSLPVAGSLYNLGNLHRMRGDLTKADAEFREGLALNERLAPNSREVAGGLQNLAGLAQTRGDLPLAAVYYGKAVVLWNQVSPRSVNWAGTLIDLGQVVQDQGNLAEAERDYRKALAVSDWQKASPLAAAETFRALGELHERQNKLDLANAEYTQAFTVLTREVPSGVSTAEAAFKLGDLARRRSQWTVARGFYTKSLSIRQRLLPRSVDLAEALHGLALVVNHDGDATEAATLFSQSLDALESQALRFGGSEIVGANFEATYSAFYRDDVDLLVAQRLYAEAFHVMERSRARALLALLAQRDLAFDDAPKDLEPNLKANRLEYDTLQDKMAHLSSEKDKAHLDQLQARLVELDGERAQLIQRIREASPKYALLQYPTPLDLAGTQLALDGGTVLLSFLVEPERTLLFVVRPAGETPSISVVTIPIAETDLRRKVQAFRTSIQTSTAYRRSPLSAQSRELYNTLLRPAESFFAKSDRLLLIPDGPLRELPFSALSRGTQFLVEWKPLHSTVSATVYVELKKRRRPPDSYRIALAAFGDPDYGLAGATIEPAPSPVLRSLVSGGSLRPLPFSRIEVEHISALYNGSTQTYLGSEATEEQAKAIGTDVRILHFAVHGLLDQKLPLNSALVFSVPGPRSGARDNGFLQAWELYQSVRWDADLAVLSACESGLGKDFQGEGLLGLTRAVQYAGARSVLASLWSVDDRRTEQLMSRFYVHLQQGESKDEALRTAQLDLLHSHAAASPFYWAAFLLDGDWK